MVWVFVFLFIAVVIMIIGNIENKKEEEKKNIIRSFPRTPTGTSSQIITNIVSTPKTKQYLYVPEELISMYERMAYDEARMFLQRIAYTMVDKKVSEEDRQIFKKFMTIFADYDPLYHELIRKAYPIIEVEEGILQSKIYPYLPEYSQETIRYVLYFAHELGDIKRVKKGRSYALYPHQGKVLS